jgi:moderate conductance mechanosensitive channel
MDKKSIVVRSLLVSISVLVFSVFFLEASYAQQTKTGTSKTTSSEEEIKQLDAKQNHTQLEIEKKENNIEAIQQEATKAGEEKVKAEAEALLKQQEAEVAKEKAEAVMQEAETNHDRSLLAKAKKLEDEAQQIKEQADVEREELELAELQERIALQKLDANAKRIEELKIAVEDIKREKKLKRSWIEKVGISIGSIMIGIILFVILGLVVNMIEKSFKPEDDIREDETTLRIKTITKLLAWLGGFIIVGSVVVVVLETFGVSLGPLLAGAGIIGLAFGFGGQYLIRDLINGVFILIEGQYRVQDVVKINDLGGLVEEINLRITVLRDLEGRVIIIPNGEIKAVINYTRGYSQALLNIGVAYKENVDQVMDIIKEIGSQMREDPYFQKLILDDLEMFGVDAFSDSAVMIKFRIKTRPIKQWEVSREFKRRLKNKFDELGIEIPFPHRTLYWGAGRDNQRLKESKEKTSE